MRTLAFDTARTTGWAFGDLTGVRKFGSFTMPQTREDVGIYLIFAERHIEELIAAHRPKLLVYEAPLLVPHADFPEKLQKLYGLVNEVEKAATRHGLECQKEVLGKIRTHFLGAGYPRKSERVKIAVKVRCRDMGFDVDSDNEADAMALLDYMLSRERPATATNSTPLFQSKASLARARRLS